MGGVNDGASNGTGHRASNGARHAAGNKVGQPANNVPVGVFDSGVGGLTILRELMRELPDERYMYFGDTGNCPYGVRPDEAIQDLALSAARFLLGRGVKMIVVACNTATVTALIELRHAYSEAPPNIHFVGVVPAVKPAAENSRTKRVGIAATEASAKGERFKQLVADYATPKNVKVQTIGCSDLVELVERGVLDGPEAEAAVRKYIQPLLDFGIDQLVLGCTHFPALRSVFEHVAGPGVEIVDPSPAIARQTRHMLTEKGLLAAPRGINGSSATTWRAPSQRDEFWCSGEVERFEDIASVLLGAPVSARYAHAMRVPVKAE